MTTGQRLTKQIIVAVVFFLLVGGIGFGAYRLVKPVAPTPTPNPTINLAPIRILEQKLLDSGGGDYDFVAKVNNPNTNYGSSDVEYEIKFFNNNGNQISQKTGGFYILPGQTKYVVVPLFKLPEQINQAIMSVYKIDWRKIDPLSMASATLISRSVTYSQISQPGIFAKAGGSILNSSNFDFGKADLAVLLFDQSDSLIAANRTEIRTFLAGTSRGFEVSWFKPFVGQVNRVEVEADTNVFENSNFLRQYQRQERFQQYY